MKFLESPPPCAGQIRAFFRPCAGPRRPGYEAALDLLLSPEEGELPAHFRRLASLLADAGMGPREIPAELFLLFCEIVGFCGKIPEDPGLGRFLERIVSKVPGKVLPRLFEKRYPARPFLRFLDQRRIFPRGRLFSPGPRPEGLAARWRLLRNRLLKSPKTQEQSPLETTLADLRYLVAGKPRERLSRARWKNHGRHVLLPAAAAPPSFAPSVSRLYWEGRGPRTLAYWERLLCAQAEELAAVRELATEVSRRTGRVVFSWHNASFAAMGGWAFEPVLAQIFPRAPLDHFSGAVLRAAARIRKTLDRGAAAELFAMRAERIYAPRAAQALGEIRALRAFGCSGGPDRGPGPENAAPLASIGPSATQKSEWPGALAPHQRAPLERVLSLCEAGRSGWEDGLALLFALAEEGQKMLDAGKIASFVLPWIDKFFISSRRKADQGYLARLFRLVRARVDTPLVLFWEDTTHRVPSFRLALDELSESGLPFCGIGVFDRRGSSRENAAQIIRGRYPGSCLFALRPVSDNRRPGTFRDILAGADQGFTRSYDSSWKDNLAFLYAGTQVVALLPAQTEMEEVSSWVGAGRGRHPFGAWLRRWLRGQVLGGGHDPSDPLSSAFAAWANLL